MASSMVARDLPVLRSDMAWQIEVLAEIALAMALGGAIGFERELAARPAGLRTHSVEGLTTAASILITAGLGIAVALRQWLLAVSRCATIVMVLRGLGWMEARLAKPE